MTIPDVDSIDSYGGVLSNYVAGVVDPTTDRDASAANEAYASTAAMTHTAIRVYARLTLNGASAPTLVAHDAVWGSLPGVAPTLSHVGTGHLRITWPATVLDELHASHAVNLRDGWANVRTVSSLPNPRVVPTGGNVLDIYVYDNAGTLTDGSSETLAVFGL
jgi:hypothetical protein